MMTSALWTMGLVAPWMMICESITQLLLTKYNLKQYAQIVCGWEYVALTIIYQHYIGSLDSPNKMTSKLFFFYVVKQKEF